MLTRLPTAISFTKDNLKEHSNKCTESPNIHNTSYILVGKNFLTKLKLMQPNDSKLQELS